MQNRLRKDSPEPRCRAAQSPDVLEETLRRIKGTADPSASGSLIGVIADDCMRQLIAAWDVVDGHLGDLRSDQPKKRLRWATVLLRTREMHDPNPNKRMPHDLGGWDNLRFRELLPFRFSLSHERSQCGG